MLAGTEFPVPGGIGFAFAKLIKIKNDMNAPITLNFIKINFII